MVPISVRASGRQVQDGAGDETIGEQRVVTGHRPSCNGFAARRHVRGRLFVALGGGALAVGPAEQRVRQQVGGTLTTLQKQNSECDNQCVPAPTLNERFRVLPMPLLP